jgi:hypothetical protein
LAVLAAAALGYFIDWLAGARTRRSARAADPADSPAAYLGDEFVTALALAVKSYVESESNEEYVLETIVRTLGWSPTRARWFLVINRDQVERAARKCRA